MANYTVELRTIQKDYNIFQDINYNLYNNDLKKDFEEKFINHFYYREIGFETVGRFVKELESSLNMIYPYYKHLYTTMCYEYNVIENYNLTETITEKQVSNENSKNKSNTTNKSNDISKVKNTINANEESREHDTPISATAKKYPSNITNSESSETGENESNVNSNSSSILSLEGTSINNQTKEHIRNTKGNIGVMATQDLIVKERGIIVNIDKLIFDELDNLFMQVW